MHSFLGNWTWSNSMALWCDWTKMLCNFLWCWQGKGNCLSKQNVGFVGFENCFSLCAIFDATQCPHHFLQFLNLVNTRFWIMKILRSSLAWQCAFLQTHSEHNKSKVLNGNGGLQFFALKKDAFCMQHFAQCNCKTMAEFNNFQSIKMIALSVFSLLSGKLPSITMLWNFKWHLSKSLSVWLQLIHAVGEIVCNRQRSFEMLWKCLIELHMQWLRMILLFNLVVTNAKWLFVPKLCNDRTELTLWSIIGFMSPLHVLQWQNWSIIWNQVVEILEVWNSQLHAQKCFWQCFQCFWMSVHCLQLFLFQELACTCKKFAINLKCSGKPKEKAHNRAIVCFACCMNFCGNIA